jgi:hypothetical protein
MKKTVTVALVALCALSACRPPNHCNTNGGHRSGKPPKGCPGNSPDFIPMDSANKMVNSYLHSIQYQTNDTDLRSITIDAGALRTLLDSEINSGTITTVQIKLAHTLDYINRGHVNQPAGFNCDALTLVISGVDAMGNYVNVTSDIINHGRPCPHNCPQGTAGNAFFIQ